MKMHPIQTSQVRKASCISASKLSTHHDFLEVRPFTTINTTSDQSNATENTAPGSVAPSTARTPMSNEDIDRMVAETEESLEEGEAGHAYILAKNLLEQYVFGWAKPVQEFIAHPSAASYVSSDEKTALDAAIQVASHLRRLWISRSTQPRSRNGNQVAATTPPGSCQPNHAAEFSASLLYGRRPCWRWIARRWASCCPERASGGGRRLGHLMCASPVVCACRVETV